MEVEVLQRVVLGVDGVPVLVGVSRACRSALPTTGAPRRARAAGPSAGGWRSAPGSRSAAQLPCAAAGACRRAAPACARTTASPRNRRVAFAPSPLSTQPGRRQRRVGVSAKFDVIVIGAGPAGEVAAGQRSPTPASTSRSSSSDLVGGECSLLRLHALEGAAAARRAARRGQARAGAAETVDGDARRRRASSPAATRSSTTSTTPRRCPGSRSTAIELVRGAARARRRAPVGRRATSA